MKSTIKFLISFLVLTVLSYTAFALPSAVTVTDTSDATLADTEHHESVQLMGEGTLESPFEISSTVEFNNFASLIKTNNAVYGSKYYKLMDNVDFGDATLVPFGTEAYPFTGTFDGNGYSLYNVSINNVNCSGVIGYMKAGTVKNLSVLYKDMTSRESFSTLKYFGGIVGNIKPASANTVIIEGCSTDGDIMLSDSNTVYMGGIVGQIRTESGNLYVENCVSRMSFDAQAESDSYVGGFVAYAKAGSSKDFMFKNCVSFGDVKLISNTISSTVAGFAAYVNKDEEGWTGWASDEEAELAATSYHFESCVAVGNVYGESPKTVYVGGFIAKIDGSGDITSNNIYKNASQTVGSAVGSEKVNGLGISTDESNLKNKDFYSSTLGFDFNNDWYISSSGLGLRGVAKSLGAGTILENKDVRLNSRPGLRFKADIEVIKRDYCFEYGFIIAKKSELGNKELTFDYTGKIVYGVAFDSTTDKFIDKDDTTITISGVVTNIPEEYYGEVLVARTYVKLTSGGETVIVYSEPQSSSINLSALAVKNSEGYEYLTDNQKQLLETMLPAA